MKSRLFSVAMMFLLSLTLFLIHSEKAMAQRARFEVTLFRFTVNHETRDDVLQRDGAGDEVSFSRMVRLYNRRAGGEKILSGDDFTPTRGQMPPNPIRAGHAASNGGLKSGDDVLTGPHIPLFSGELIRGENAVIILLSVWEMDGRYELQNAYANALENFMPDMESVADRVALNSPPSNVMVRDFDWNARLPAGSIPAIDVFLTDGPLGLGDPKDRPIGMVRRGNRYSFIPKLMILNFDNASRAADTNEGSGLGVIKISYTDDQRLLGDYTLYVRIRRV